MESWPASTCKACTRLSLYTHSLLVLRIMHMERRFHLHSASSQCAREIMGVITITYTHHQPPGGSGAAPPAVLVRPRCSCELLWLVQSVLLHLMHASSAPRKCLQASDLGIAQPGVMTHLVLLSSTASS